MTAHKIKMADIAAKLDTTTTTIGNWIGEFGQFFSPGAKLEQGKRRGFTDDDLIVLATIAKLSHDGLNYGDIRQQLADGIRVDSYEAINYGVNRTLIPEDAIPPLIDYAQLETKIEILEEERARLLSDLEKRDQQLADKDRRIEALHQQIAELRERVGRAEAEAELRRQEKRRGWFG